MSIATVRDGLGAGRKGAAIATFLLVLLWLQPIAQRSLGVPVGTIGLGAYLTFTLLGVVAGRVNPVLPRGVGLAYTLLAWSTALTLFAEKDINVVYDWFTFFLAFAAGPHLLRDAQGRNAVHLSAEIGLILFVSATLVQHSISPDLFGLTSVYDNGRLPSLHYNASGGALFLLMGAAIVLASIVLTHHRSRLRISLDIALTAAAAWAIIQTGSRAALVALLVIILLVAIVGGTISGGRKQLPVRFTIAAVLLSAAIFLARRAEGQLIERSVGLLDLSAARGSVWQEAIQLISEAPLSGPSSFVVLPGVDNPHNVWLEVALQVGIPGLMLYGGLAATVSLRFVKALRESTEEPAQVRIAGCLFLATLVFGFTHSGAVNNAYLWLVIGSAMSVRISTNVHPLRAVWSIERDQPGKTVHRPSSNGGLRNVSWGGR